MADPLDPKGPNTPNPNLTNAVNDLQAGERLLATMEQHLRSMAERSDEVSKKFKNVNLELTTAVDLAGDTEEAVKEIASAARSLRKGILDSKSSKDALASVKAIRDAQEILLKRTKDMPAAQAKVSRQMKEMQGWMDKLSKTTGDLADNDMRELQRVMHAITMESEQMAKNLKTASVSHLSRQLVGITGAMKTFGIGKQYAGRVEKYAGFADVAGKLKEAQRARFDKNKDMFRDKREKALAAVSEKYGIDMANPKAMRMAGKKTAAQMGLDTTGWTKKDYIALATGKETGKVGDVAARYHGTGATGVASKVATGVENGLAGLSETIAELAPVMAAVEGAVMLLVQVFDAYVAQNKKMEEGLGKGGLFSTEAGGRGFTGARYGLNPSDAVTALGINFERNLKIAQSIAQGGLGIQEIVRAGEQEETTGQKVVGPAGEGFMAGGAGMIQRAVVGAGRLAGMTDAEGVERVLKLMGEYRETLQQGENFFIQVSKGAKAAGLSTTKYISIIDEVMNSFDRMNRSLDSTVSVMGELSKSGRLASEDMQQYFKFLTGGMGAQEKAGTPEQMFLLNRMSKGGRANLASNQAELMKGLINRAAGGELDIPGVSPDDIRKGFGGTPEEMNKFIRNTLQPAINNADVDDTRKKSWNNLIEQMRDQKQQTGLWERFSKTGDAVGTGFGTQVQGMNMQTSIAMQQAAMEFILRQGSLKEFAAGPGEFAAKHKETAGLAQMFNNNPLMIKSMLRTQEIAAGMRLSDVQQDTGAAGVLGKELTPMLKKKGVKIDFTSPSAFKKYFQEHGNELLDDIANLNTTTSYWGKASVKQQGEATEDERQAALTQAKTVGAQTQSTADIFAAAFSKWFINIIEGIEAIIDLLPGSKKADRDRLKADAQTYLKPQGALFTKTQDMIGDLGDRIGVEQELIDRAHKKGDKQGEAQHKVAMKVWESQMSVAQAAVSSGTFMSQDMEDQFAVAMRAFSNGLTAKKMRQNQGLDVTPGATGGAGTGSTVNNHIVINNGADTTTKTPTARDSNRETPQGKPQTTKVISNSQAQ